MTGQARSAQASSITGTRRYPEEPEFSGLDLYDPMVQKAMQYQRHLTADKAARTRKQNKRLVEVEAEPRVIVDGSTGEVIDQPVRYREGNVEVPLPLGMTPADVPPPACENDYVMVCRALYRAAQDHLRDVRLSAGARLLWAELVIEADPGSGEVNLTAAEVGRRHGVNKSTALRWMRRLAALGLVELAVTPGRRDNRVTVLHYDTVVRLDLRNRINGAAARLSRRRVIERETTVRERIVEGVYQ